MTYLPPVSPTYRLCDRFNRRFSLLTLLTALLIYASPATSLAQTAAPPFLPAVGYETGGYLSSATAVGDLNGDGKPDLVIGNYVSGDKDRTSGSVRVLLGKGDGTFGQPVSYSFESTATWIVIADVNGDHKPDLIVSGQANQNSTFEPLGVYLNNGGFLLTDAYADGFTFVVQNAGLTALGTPGEGLDSTGLFVDGALPTVPSINLSNTGIDLHSGYVFLAQAAYDGTNLGLTLTDTMTQAMWPHSFAINIPATVGADTAYVGFTASTGDRIADREILTWTYVSGTP